MNFDLDLSKYVGVFICWGVHNFAWIAFLRLTQPSLV
jgi:hypothetical protein